MDTRGVQNAQMQGSQGHASGTPEGMQFPWIEFAEGDKSTNGLSLV